MDSKITATSYWGKQYLIRKFKAIEYLGGKCRCCEYDKYYGALEFHHRDPNAKEVVWNKLKKRSWDKIKQELDKCDLLCANCHREVHKVDGLLEAVIEWRDAVDNSKINGKNCKFCGKFFKPYASKMKFCSLLCLHKNSEKVKWPDNLVDLVQKSSKSAIARKLGVSGKAVEKRLKKHHRCSQ